MRKLRAGVWVGLYLCCAWTPSVKAAAPDPQVIVEGSRRAGDMVRASGHDVPLLHALEQIVPPNYSVNVPNAGAWADIPVSWHGKQSFEHVLSEILASNGSLQARVNTDLNLVTVTAVASIPAQASPMALPVAAKVTANEPSTIAPTPLLNEPQPLAAAPAPSTRSADSPLPKGVPLTLTASASTPGAAVPQLASAAPADSASGPTLWVLRQSDGSVRNALARWAREADWQFIWAVPTDFSIDAFATIHGSFEDALHSVVDALSHSQVPIQIVLYRGNRVLRVTAKGAG
jgi:hypothetical protein